MFVGSVRGLTAAVKGEMWGNIFSADQLLSKKKSGWCMHADEYAREKREASKRHMQYNK